MDKNLNKEVKLMSTLRKVLLIEKNKYNQKGFKILLAVLHLFIFIKIYPIILISIWPQVLKHLTKQQIFVIFISGANIISLMFYNTFFIFVYKNWINLQSKKVYYQSWPWNKNKKQWNLLLNASIKQNLISSIIYTPLTLFIISKIISIKLIFQIEKAPSNALFLLIQLDSIIILSQGLFFMIVEDLSFSISHYFLHQKQLYWIHKHHHQYIAPVSISAEYAHILELLIGNYLPASLGFLILSLYQQVHIITAILWIGFRVMNAIDNHCGYSFDWNILEMLPFSAGSQFHAYHHTYNSGNIGSMFIFYDLLFGTYQDYFNYKVKRILQKDQLKTQQ